MINNQLLDELIKTSPKVFLDDLGEVSSLPISDNHYDSLVYLLESLNLKIPNLMTPLLQEDLLTLSNLPTKNIVFTQEYVQRAKVLLLDKVDEKLSVAMKYKNKVYIIDGTHRYISSLHTGKIPEGYLFDHKDMDKIHNIIKPLISIVKYT